MVPTLLVIQETPVTRGANGYSGHRKFLLFVCVWNGNNGSWFPGSHEVCRRPCLKMLAFEPKLKLSNFSASLELLVVFDYTYKTCSTACPCTVHIFIIWGEIHPAQEWSMLPRGLFTRLPEIKSISLHT